MEIKTLILATVILSAAQSLSAQEELPSIRQGNEFYKKQQFNDAIQHYGKAIDVNGKSAQAQYNLGNALYKNKQFDEAASAFEKASVNSSDAALKSRAYYNNGVALTRQQKLEESIEMYKQALRINPQDEQARENLQKAINEKQKQPPQQRPQNQNNKDDKKEKDKNQNPKPNNSKLNKKQVEQMLNALRQDEKKIQQNLQKKNNTGGANSKDW